MFRIVILLVVTSVFANKKFFPSDVVDIFSDIKTNSTDRIENYPNKKELARRFLKSYNSLRPVALLADETKESLTSSIDFIKDIFKITPSAKQITFLVSRFNDTGTSSLAEILGSDPEKIYNTLSSQFQTENSELGHRESTGTLAFYAILNAASTLPQDAAILVFIDRKINDEDLAGHTSIIRKKNIKVYVIWGGAYPTKTNEERLLKELCTYSGGLFLINDIKDLSTYNYREFINNKTNRTTSTIFSKTNLLNDSNCNFPIDSEVTCIHLVLTPSIIEGTLITPTGEHVNVSDKHSIASYGTGSYGITERGQKEVYFDTTQSDAVGLWHLDVRASIPYNITLFVCTKLTAHAYFVRENARAGEGDNIGKNKKKILKLDFTGQLGTVNNITFIDSKGHLQKNKVKYNVKGLLDLGTNKNNTEVNFEANNISDKLFQVLIQGTDIKGNHFSRLTYVNDQSSKAIFPQPILTIDVGLGSELITTGGRSSTITFEVTNLRNIVADTRFYCKDEKSILGSMQPYRRIISPQETVIVTVTLSSRYGVYQDLITFIASVGSDYVEKKVIVDLGTQTQFTSDNTSPSLDYSYLSDCSKVVFSSCDQGTWTIEVKAKDTGSGLLQLTSIPKGIYFQDGFTTGTREEVTGTYSDSCCNADLQLIAIDRNSNRRTITVNAYRAMWGPGQIAALCLGIILFILLIVLIVYLIRRCIKQREIYNLPTYRGGGI